jgi:hypothetical protein
VDATLLSKQQKLLLYKLAVCPRLTWDLSVNFLPVSWLKTTLQPIATKFLKRWCGLARSADTGCIYLPKEKGGLEMPSLVTLYKKLQASKAASFICSQDPVVRAIASQETQRETQQQRMVFKPYKIAVAEMKQDPGVSSRKLKQLAKARIEDDDTSARLAYSTSLARQNKPLHDDSRAPHLWATTVTTLHEQTLSFARNALTDTVHYNDNLHL